MNKTILFSPTAWAKLLHMKKSSSLEVSGFGITKVDNPLYIVDFVTIKQECTSTHTEMDDEALEGYFVDMEEKGLIPSQYFRIWIHTHPGMSPNPSGTDESTFTNIFFGSIPCSWAIMLIVGAEDKVFARLRLGKVDIVGQIDVPLDAKIDWSTDFIASDISAWTEEYKNNISEKKYPLFSPGSKVSKYADWADQYANFGWQRTAHGWTMTEKSDDIPDVTSFTERKETEFQNAQRANQASLALNKSKALVDDFAVLTGKLKELIDPMSDRDKIWLIDEINSAYELDYLISADEVEETIQDSKKKDKSNKKKA